MCKKIITSVLLLIWGHAHAAMAPKRINIDNKSIVRSICNIEFPAIKGLTVEANLASSVVYNSRVNNERYGVCPYDVEIKYGGQVMRMDFGAGFDLESVRKYRHSMPVDSGFFVYDGQDWTGQADTLRDRDNDIQVTDEGNFVLVTGILHRRDQNSKAEDYCYAMTLVYETGFATAGICSEKKEKSKAWRELFGHKVSIRYRP